MKKTPEAGATAIDRFVRPFRQFAALESSGGLLLISCIIVALLWANSPWSASYFHLWHIPLTFGFAGRTYAEPLHFWINDALMAVFFLVVGLEMKRELLIGELASWQRAALPVAAAIGGMALPALIYFAFNRSGPGAAGWGIPMATDIAFALGILTLLGKRAPPSLRVFLAALAIADDLGAVLVIALFYTETISGISLAIAAAFFVFLIILNRAGARHPLWYFIPGLGLWLAFLESGIHPTVAGVLLATTIPARTPIDGKAFLHGIEGILQTFGRSDISGKFINADANKHAALQALEKHCEQAESPMLRFEHALAPWITYLIMPVFALANAGVTFGEVSFRALGNPVSLGIIGGLVLGKPIGIFLFCLLVTQLKWAALPNGVNWRHILGVGCLAGIGFTMSLFVANLAFVEGTALETLAILVASLVSGLAGAVILRTSSKL
jgi:NhaA family Na+:H+ antiporter